MNRLEISTQQFHELTARVNELAGRYLESLDSRPVFPGSDGKHVQQLFNSPAPQEGIGLKALEELEQVMRHSRAQNGRFFGYVLGSGEPVAAAADLLASVLNQNVTAWRSGPAAVTIEKIVIEWLAQAIGCPGFSGSLAGGGSAANLMGLTMAREAKLRANECGLRASPQATVYASDQVHMSIPKALAILGLGTANLRLVPGDEQFRMVPAKLEDKISADVRDGYVPLAVVASAGTVNTGAIDPLKEISQVAKHHNAWLHVDGAYGALAALAEPSKFSGLELADSISLDPHKWLYQPLDCGCLLFRDAAVARAAFSHTGAYAKSLSEDPVEGFAFFEESLELSRRFRALKLWLSLRYHGFHAFRESIRQDLAHAQRLAASIRSHSQLQLMAPVELSAVCFRYRGDHPEADLNRINRDILNRVVGHGRVYLSNASLHGSFCLRACFVNHRTKEADVDAVIPEVLAAAKETLSGT
jgi:glutamate/tyrosine decarboxylase-like PLP-dependent enzyme